MLSSPAVSGGVRTVNQIVKYQIRYFADPVLRRYLVDIYPVRVEIRRIITSYMCPVVENVFTAYSQPKVVQVPADISN